jgi:transcription termination/antitermination protein NusA
MSRELLRAIEFIQKEKNLSLEILFKALEESLVGAYKKNFDSNENVNVKMDRESGEIHVYSIKEVVEVCEDPTTQISVEDAKAISQKLEIGDTVDIEITPRKFGRIAAQTAKQQVIQKIREAEREAIYDSFVTKTDELITGKVQRTERKNVIVDLGKAEGVLLPSEQSGNDKYEAGERYKFYVSEVKKTTKAPRILLSRTNPSLVKRLFELEVPELNEGIVEIKGISREPGSRTKLAVCSYEENVDPVGACVGQKGNRVQAVVDELRGEKIDIIAWSPDPAEFISSSLSPANVVKVVIDESHRNARVIVPDFQLSLAIGKEGQNARLAARLTGWKIDIKSESQRREELEKELLFSKGVSTADETEAIETDTETVVDTEAEEKEDLFK